MCTCFIVDPINIPDSIALPKGMLRIQTRISVLYFTYCMHRALIALLTLSLRLYIYTAKTN